MLNFIKAQGVMGNTKTKVFNLEGFINFVNGDEDSTGRSIVQVIQFKDINGVGEPIYKYLVEYL